MKRAESEVKECQEVEEREVKRSRTEEESSEPSDINPFLVEPILRKLLKKLDKVAQLKDLRKMCVLWDNVNVEELEDRAFKGKLKAIDFKWTDRFKSKEEAEKELVEFLEDTRAIPRLFNFFKFNITESLKVLQSHLTFFSDYPIFRVELYTNLKEFKELDQAPMKYLLSLIGPNLKEIQIPEDKGKFLSTFEPKSPNWPKPEQELILPNLQKLIIVKECLFNRHHSVRVYYGHLTEFFKSAISKGGSENGHITSLGLTSLPGEDLGSFPGLDPPRMTHLDLSKCVIFASARALKLTTGLMTLVEKGMRLKDFRMKIYSGEVNAPDSTFSLAQNHPRIASNLTHFFATQSSTLTTLHFKVEFYQHLLQEEPDTFKTDRFGLLQLPIFPVLHTLNFTHFVNTCIGNEFEGGPMFRTPLFEVSDPLHFPALVNATFDSETSMSVLGDNRYPDPEGSRYHFKRLKIFVDTWKLENWALIESIEYLNVPGRLLAQVRLPWADSLRELSILFVDEEDADEPLKVSHLKKLETLTIQDRKLVVWEKFERDPYEYLEDNRTQVTPSKYLSNFVEVTELSLTSIKFVGLKMTEGIKEEFIKYFPFPVQFEDY